MKIVFTDDVIYGYAKNASWAHGGAERYQWLLARALAASGWRVTVGVRSKLEAGKRKVVDGVEFVGIGTEQILSSWYRFLKSEKPEWWYWATASHLWGPAVEIAKRAGVRTIFSSQFDTDVIPSEALFRRRRWWPLYAWGLTRTDKIFVQHTDQLAQLRSLWRGKASILPGLVAQNQHSYVPHASRDSYVAWVGMLRQPKRPDLLVDIARRIPECRFLVCGGLTEHRTVAGFAERVLDEMSRVPNIEFMGKVDADKALRIIGDAAALLSTSDGEGFPCVFLEAWSNGTPVVSLKVDPDHVIATKGLGVVSESTEKAASDIRTMLGSPDKRENIAAKARAYMTTNHGESTVVSIFERGLLKCSSDM